MDSPIQDNFGNLNFDSILKRNVERNPASKLPAEMFQVCIFYSRPVVEELQLENEEIAQEIIKGARIFNRNKVKFALQNITELNSIILDKQRFVFPLYSREVFMSRQEAENFVPLFIKSLIEKETIPQDVILENGQIDDNKIQATLVPLTITFLEKNLSEFKDKNGFM